MRFNKYRTPGAAYVSEPPKRLQCAFGIALACAVLAGCSPINSISSLVQPQSSGFKGMVAADEPQAALVGQDVLAGGGSAADAAVAMAFTMALTLPSQVSLGSSGACIAYDNEKPLVEAISFTPPPTEGGLVPALPRGLFLLHADFGKKTWQEVLAPIESLARAGVPASRAFVRQLAPAANSVVADPLAARIFFRSDGQPLAEGDLLRNTQLASVLGRMALHGVGEFYVGSWADEVTADTRRAGATFTSAALRDFTPAMAQPVSVRTGDDTALFLPSPATTGLVEAIAWKYLGADGNYVDAPDADRAHVFAEAVDRALAQRASWASAAPDSKTILSSERIRATMAGLGGAHQPVDAKSASILVAGAGLVAIDGAGDAVACELTLNGQFGTGRMAPSIGSFLAAPARAGDPDLGPMLIVNQNSNQFRFAAAPSGGQAGVQAMLQTVLTQTQLGKTLAEAIGTPRVYADAASDRVGAEKGAAIAGLTAHGHTVVETELPGRVEAIRCGSGSPSTGRCDAATDPRGFGLARVASRR